MNDRITYLNGYRLNGRPVRREEIQGIFDQRKAIVLATWRASRQRNSAVQTLIIPNAPQPVAGRCVARCSGI